MVKKRREIKEEEEEVLSYVQIGSMDWLQNWEGNDLFLPKVLYCGNEQDGRTCKMKERRLSSIYLLCGRA